MKFQKLVAPMFMLVLAACGSDRQNWHGTLEHDGKQIEYETWYHSPGHERLAGNNGMSYRLMVDGKTASMAGVYLPDDWRDNEETTEIFGKEFWAAVADKFEAVDPGKDHKEEHTWIYSSIIAMRDVPRTLPGNFFDQQALKLKAEDPEWSAEMKASHEAGERMIAFYRDQNPDEFIGQDEAPTEESSQVQFWGSRRNKNRGFRNQVREDGYEFKQRLEIWAEHFYVTGFDHSGTWAYTYKRRKGTGEDWQVVKEEGHRACNHGACPGTDKMRHRQTCDAGSVSDWYVVDGECKGNWMSGHLCNDDTSLQINHAQGIWTGWECPGHNRGIVPKCGRQFK